MNVPSHTRSGRRTSGSGSLGALLEVQAYAELDDPALDDGGRQHPRAAVGAGIGGVLEEHGIGVERVVDVEVRVEGAPPAELEDLAEPEVELFQAIAEVSAEEPGPVVRLDHQRRLVPGDRGGTTECGRDLRLRVENRSLPDRTGQALE